jgi:tRNA nucleotidyltransferase (CCA-adding enzyme)
MKQYLVGGAVRDGLLGLAVTERDYCVVGSTPDQMLSLGFKSVGRDFPVFLHPKTKEEYALARRERKTAPGHQGFECDAAASVSLEDDLKRRDLTINAIAQDEDGVLIDPYGGQKDLDAKILRHVSDAFTEDPLRVLRLARFAGRFFDLGFVIAPKTLSLVQSMIEKNMLETLSQERCLAETIKALSGSSQSAEYYLAYLFEWKILDRWLDHAISAGQLENGLQALRSVVIKTPNPMMRWIAFILGLGCFEDSGSFGLWAKKSVLPADETALGVLIVREHERLFYPHRYTPKESLEMLYALDLFRRPERLGSIFWIVRALWPMVHRDQMVVHHDESLFWALERLKNLKIDLSEVAPDERAKTVFDARLSHLIHL